MKLSLNTWQRATLSNILGSIEGKAAIVRKASKLLDVLEMTSEEKELVGWTEAEGAITWTNKEQKFDIEIADHNLFAFLSEQVKAYTFQPRTWHVPEVRKLILDMYDQLGIKDAE